jgi:general secretion pathway protein D
LLGAEAGVATGQPADTQQRVTVVADPRSNSILLRSENPARAARAKALVEQLDTPGRPGGNMFMVYLKNADAPRVAQTLRALLSGGSDAGTSPTSAPSVIGNQLGSAMAANSSGNPNTAPTAATANPFAGGNTGGGAALPGGLTIQADVANNALVIMGPEPLYNNLRSIIEKLDVRRAQVLVEALIVEVAANRMAEFGIQWQILQGINKTNVQGFGGTNFGTRDSGNNIISGSVNLGSLGQGLNVGVINGTVSIPGLGTITNLGFLARALEQETGANILSTPTLLTLDNEEARIIVGQNVPIVTGQYATTGSTSTVQPFTTVDRKDIGVLLRVRPQITEGGTIRLAIYQEVSRIDSLPTATTGLILSKRALESSVIVDDQQVAVLGGLIQDSYTDGSDRVPVLGDLPVIGSFFRFDGRKREKVNLMIFLKPTVVRNDAQGRALTSERYDYIMGEQDKSRPPERLFWQDQTVPTLPPKGLMPGTPEGNLPSITPPPREPAPVPAQ